jgi:hypothetical protein
MRAAAAPMPRLAPVSTTTLFFKFAIDGSPIANPYYGVPERYLPKKIARGKPRAIFA